ncbi:MAG TPA: sigma-54 dependent transcriptional regulator [Methylomirabilota bacterium]|jgi:DNA-binding NtrC family response regulator|nr:sigma-54 dependent transcriptional regulator [Methylomirabilota bacterium]
MMVTAVNKRILVVDDDASVVDYLVEMLNEEEYIAHGVTSPLEALAHLEREDYDLVITDIEMPGLRGLDLMEAIHARKPCQLVLLITAFGSIDSAVQAVRAGACDFVTKPFPIEALLLAIERAFRERQMHREIVRLRSAASSGEANGLIARSQAMRRVVEIARRAALTDSTVLLTGESGVGKGAVARFIHDQSPRASAPFVQINCAALPASLVESELFGVRKGAYTDARSDRPGLFIEAAGGTLFLDEIAEMPLETQPKLLQALETGTVRPLGGTSETAVNVRVIAATNHPLEEALQDRRFRPDLYHRLNVITVEIPPLRTRPEDIEPLVDLLLQRASVKLGRSVIGMTAEARRWLLSYTWPGNVRELANRIERAVALTDHDTLLLEDFSLTPRPPGSEDLLAAIALRELPLADIERAYVQHVLELVHGNKARAARILGIDRKTLYRKLGLNEATDE